MQRETRVSLSVDGRSSGDRGVSIGANQSFDVAFEGVARGTFFSATVADPDGLRPDNVRYGMFGDNRPRGARHHRGRRPESRWVLCRAGVDRRVYGGAAYQVAGVSAAMFGSRARDGIRRVAAIVLLSTGGLDRRGRDLLAAYVRDGGGILMAAGPDVDGELVRDVLGDGGLRIAGGDDQRLAGHSWRPTCVIRSSCHSARSSRRSLWFGSSA